jgi:poly-beta-1,6-N-acetyl-D-glucosamine synthase
MSYLEGLFWLSLGVVVYTYCVYPLVLAVAARFRHKPIRPKGPLPASVSVVLAAYNEETAIASRLEELAEALSRAGVPGEILVVSDGSTDRTAAQARQFASRGVRVVELAVNVGKAAALSAAWAHARHEIFVFADVRQRWAPDALCVLLNNFRDPAVGAVTGDLLLEQSNGLLAGVGLYWRYERWLRDNEGRVGSVVGVTGAISAVRRALFRPIPIGTILDDVYWPLQVAMMGFRVVRDARARAYDRLPERASDEFRRKVRTLAGNFQLLALLPRALLPPHNPIWIQFISHKILRLLVPWALATLLATSALLPARAYQIALAGQICFYTIGLLGVVNRSVARLRPVSAASSFLILNAAAAVALLVCLSGRTSQSWQKAHYARGPIFRADRLSPSFSGSTQESSARS